MKNIALLILVFALSVFSFNHSEIEWKTVSSKHFKIIFNESTEPALYASWKIAEEAYRQYIRLYKYPDNKKINLILADEDDYSNGWASWTDHTIKIWIPDSKFALRDMNVWLRDVIYHELAHIMSLEKKSSMQLLDWTIGGGYYSEDLNLEYFEPVALIAFMPMWFAEGTAQLRSEEMGGDCRDSRREMVLREAALNNRLLTLDEMSHFTHDLIGNELVYNQGYSFTKYLEQNFGKKQISTIWDDYRKKKFTGRNFSKIFMKKFNASLDDEYQKWKKGIFESAKKYSAEDTSERVWRYGHTNKMAQLSPDGKILGFLSSTKDDFGRTDLLIVSNENKKVLHKIKYAKSHWSFSKDGNSVYYLKSRKPNKNGSYLNDIFTTNLKTGKEKRVTNSARIYSFDISKDGSSAYAIRYNEGAFEFVNINFDKSKITLLDRPAIGEGYLTVSANDGLIVLTKLLHGKSSIYKYDASAKVVSPLVQNNAHEENAFVGDDNRIYYSADYNGVTNIYSVDPDGKDMKKLSSVAGGAFCPFYKAGSLLFSSYSANGFSISKINVEAGTDYSVNDLPSCKYTDVPKPRGKVNISPVDYKPKTGRSIWSGVTYLAVTDYDDALQDKVLGRDTDSGWAIGLDIVLGLNMFKTDPLEKKSIYGGIAIAVGNSFSGDEKQDTDSNSLAFKRGGRYDFCSFENRVNRTLDIKKLSNNLNSNPKSSAENDSATDETSLFVVTAPYYGIESKRFKPTIGIEVELQLISMMPYGIYLSPFISHRLSRDINVGFSPFLSLYPILLADSDYAEGVFSADMPFWLNWFHTGYINQDIQYNLAGVSYVNVQAGPQISPQIENPYGYDLVKSSTLFKAGFEAAHYFPLFKYGSFSLAGSALYYVSNREMNSTTGTWTGDVITTMVDTVESKSILGLKFNADLTLPVIRDINRGKLYADNLYAGIHYSADMIASGKFLKNADSGILFDRDYNTPNAYGEHKIGASLTLGFIKDYAFNRHLQVMVYRKLFAQETGVDIIFTF